MIEILAVAYGLIAAVHLRIILRWMYLGVDTYKIYPKETFIALLASLFWPLAWIVTIIAYIWGRI